MPFFAIFIILPLLEIFVFMVVGEHIGLGTTLLLALLTAILGGSIVRYQGLHVLHEMRTRLEQGRAPLGEIFDGACLLVAGATLITPGFVTDTIGFLLLVPPVRGYLWQIIQARTTWAGTTTQEPEIIEAEFEHVKEDE